VNTSPADSVSYTLSLQQEQLITLPYDSKIFLEGPAGSGKTSAAVARLLELVHQGLSLESTLVLVPQLSLGQPYQQALRQADLPSGGQFTLLTIGGLAQRCVQLFWPAIAQAAGFAQPERPPVFLTLETAQYCLARLVKPLQDQHYFETLTIDNGRLYSQFIDNLNKSAAVGFGLDQIVEKLKSAWVGKPEQTRIYDQAQDCALHFRNYCLNNNLLDFSLQLDTFSRYIWPLQSCQNYLTHSFQYLVYDNIEEDIPLAHDLVHAWLPSFQGALIIQDQDGGYRSFLGADPQNGNLIKNDCSTQLEFSGSFISSSEVSDFSNVLHQSINRTPVNVQSTQFPESFSLNHQRYYPQMVNWVADQAARLVN
jgi:hypothetical protein